MASNLRLYKARFISTGGHVYVAAIVLDKELPGNHRSSRQLFVYVRISSNGCAHEAHHSLHCAPCQDTTTPLGAVYPRGVVVCNVPA